MVVSKAKKKVPAVEFPLSPLQQKYSLVYIGTLRDEGTFTELYRPQYKADQKQVLGYRIVTEGPSSLTKQQKWDWYVMQPDTKKQHSHYHAVITFKKRDAYTRKYEEDFLRDFIHPMEQFMQLGKTSIIGFSQRIQCVGSLNDRDPLLLGRAARLWFSTVFSIL